jgi:hypothetical protein
MFARREHKWDNMIQLKLPKEYHHPVLAIIACIAGVFIFGWQLEIIMIWISNDIYHFEFPFFLEKLFGFENGISVWLARDIWYAELGLSLLSGLWGAYEMGARYYTNKLSRRAVCNGM